MLVGGDHGMKVLSPPAGRMPSVLLKVRVGGEPFSFIASHNRAELRT
jgi:hypothetical protein